MLTFASHNFLEDLALVLCVGAIVAVIFQRLHLPVVAGYLLAGLAVGPHVPIPLLADASRVHTLAEFGVILLMFGLGLEFSVRKLLRIGPAAIFIAAVQVGLMIWLGYECARALGWTELESVFTGAVVSISSTTIVAKAFDEGGVEGRLRELVLSVLLAEDLIAVIELAVLTEIASEAPVSPALLGVTLGKLSVFLAIIVGVGILLVPRAIRLVVRLERNETLVVASVGICFAFAIAAAKAGYSVALGAFIAGMLCAESGEAARIEHLAAPVRDIFAAIFFVSVGTLLDPRLLAVHWPALLVLTAAVVGGKIIGVTAGALLGGNGTRTSVQAGMSLAQIGEFSFIIAAAALELGAARDFVYTLAVAVSTITTFLTPFLIRASGPAGAFADRLIPAPLKVLETFYDSWMERLRPAAQRAARPPRLLGPVVAMASCALLIPAVIIGAKSAMTPLAGAVSAYFGAAAPAAERIVDLIALAVCAILAAVIWRAARAAAAKIAEALLPGIKTAERRTARAALSEIVRVAIVVLDLAVTLAIVQPFLRRLDGLVLLLAVATLAAVVISRCARKVKRQAPTLMRLLIAEAPPDAARADDEGAGPLAAIARVSLKAGDAAVGRTVDELDLHAQSGAMVAAVVRGSRAMAPPDGGERLLDGDVLVLAGSHDALEAAIGALSVFDSRGAAAPRMTGAASQGLHRSVRRR